jgi:protein PET117
LRAGVYRDDERRKKKEQRLLNMKELKEQQELHEALLKTQQVSQLPSSEPVTEENL